METTEHGNIVRSLERIRDLLDSSHKPNWIEPLFQSVLNEETSSYSVHHTLNDIQLLVGLMEEDDKDALSGWLETDHTPEWFGTALGAFASEDDTWQKSRIMADLSTAYSAISQLIETDEEE